MPTETTSAGEMIEHIERMWYRDGQSCYWMRKGYEMQPIPLADAYAEQLRIDARMARRKTLKKFRNLVKEDWNDIANGRY